MRLYLVRRTRSFIQDNYAETDSEDWPEVSHLRGRKQVALPNPRA